MNKDVERLEQKLDILIYSLIRMGGTFALEHDLKERGFWKDSYRAHPVEGEK